MRLYAADTALLAQAAALLQAGQRDAAEAVLRGVTVRSWAKERMVEGMKDERKAA